MGTSCVPRSSGAPRNSVTTFGAVGSRRVSESATVEAQRRFLRKHTRSLRAVADLAGVTVGRVYEEMESRRMLSLEVHAAALSLVTPDALASLPAPAILRETLPAAHHMSVQATDLLLAVALAERDGVWDAGEARDIEERVSRLGRTAASIALTARVAAGLALAGEVAP